MDIIKYEKEILKEVLGDELYALYIIGIEESTQIYKDIRDGKAFSFEFCGQTINKVWNGLENAEKVSLSAYFTYYKYKERKASQSTDVGEILADSEHAVRVDPTAKVVNAWFEMRQLYGVTPRGFNHLNTAHYVFYNDLSSLYNFLLANTETYPTWVFKPKNSINGFNY